PFARRSLAEDPRARAPCAIRRHRSRGWSACSDDDRPPGRRRVRPRVAQPGPRARSDSSHGGASPRLARRGRHAARRGLRHRRPLASRIAEIHRLHRRRRRPLPRPARRRALRRREPRRPAAARRRQRGCLGRDRSDRAPREPARVRPRARARDEAGRMDRADDAEPAQCVELALSGGERIVRGVPGPRLPGASHGAPRDRPAAHRGGIGTRRDRRGVHAVGAAAIDAVALSGRDRGAGAAPSFRQRRHRGTPVRIALLSVSAGLGGSETSLLELVRGLAATPGVEPVVVLPRSGPLEPRVRAAGGVPRILAMPDALLGFGEWSMRGVGEIGRRGATLARAAAATRTHGRALAELLRDLSPHAVPTTGLKMHVLAARAADPGVPIVWHVHEYLSPRRLSRILLRHYLRRASAIVANSRSVAVDLAGTLGAGAPISTIYNAAELAAFPPGGPCADLDRLSGLPLASPGTCRVGLLATFARWKGHDVFLRAVRETSAPLRAYVIGGPMYDTRGSQHTIDELRARAAA